MMVYTVHNSNAQEQFQRLQSEEEVNEQDEGSLQANISREKISLKSLVHQ